MFEREMLDLQMTLIGPTESLKSLNCDLFFTCFGRAFEDGYFCSGDLISGVFRAPENVF